jgi:hypothetical protein
MVKVKSSCVDHAKDVVCYLGLILKTNTLSPLGCALIRFNPLVACTPRVACEHASLGQRCLLQEI